MRPRALVLLGLLLCMIAAPFVSPAAAQQGESDHEDEPIHLALILHQHQPYYRNVATDFYELPWVRVHAIHEYVDSPGNPRAHCARVRYESDNPGDTPEDAAQVVSCKSPLGLNLKN